MHEEKRFADIEGHEGLQDLFLQVYNASFNRICKTTKIPFCFYGPTRVLDSKRNCAPEHQSHRQRSLVSIEHAINYAIGWRIRETARIIPEKMLAIYILVVLAISKR